MQNGIVCLSKRKDFTKTEKSEIKVAFSQNASLKNFLASTVPYCIHFEVIHEHCSFCDEIFSLKLQALQ